MKPEPDYADTAALRDYVETVAELLRVEPTASWSEHDSPSMAYIALSERSPRHPGRLLMAQWSSEAGWCLALEPERAEEPEVLAVWPEPRRPGPMVVARRIRGALSAAAGAA